jgi:predicted outer membrane repeat protein
MFSRISARATALTIAVFTILLTTISFSFMRTEPVRANGSIIYVDIDASAGGNGQTWGTAYKYLQDALDQTNANGSTDYEIWVAEGVYYPDEDSNGDHVNGAMTESFRLNYGNVQLYGGFVGTETLRTQRNWAANPTVLSGDIDGNDIANGSGVITSADDIVGNNSHHVLFLDGVTNETITETTIIDGLIITAGQANGSGEDVNGGSMYCDGHEGNWLNPHICSPMLSNLTFSGNRANGYGGALYNYAYHDGHSSPTLTYVTFSGNKAGDAGGAMYNRGHFGGESNPTLVNVLFINNSAVNDGGALVNYAVQGTSQPSLTNVVFTKNSAGDEGGAVFNLGTNGDASPTFTNVTIQGNSAGDDGGGIYSSSYPSLDSVVLKNVIVWGNTAVDQGAQIYSEYVNLNVGYSDIQGGLAGSGVYYSNSSLTNLGGNIDENPRFVAAGIGNLRLFDNSPCIDAGDNTSVPSGIVVDLDGSPRFIDFPPPGGTGNGSSPFVDLGAYEEQLDGFHEHLIYLPLVQH